MRTALVIGVLALPVSAVAAPLEPFTASAPEAVVVVPDPMPQDAMTTDYRRAFAGKVTKVQPDVENGTLVVIGNHRFRATLPGNVTLPIRVGDTLEVELWSTTASKQELGFNGIHARITDAKGAPVLFTDAAPAGWTFAIGATSDLPRHARVLERHAVDVRAPDLRQAVFGWVKGTIAGADYIVYGEASVVDPVAAKHAPKSDVPAWSNVINSAVIRVKPVAIRKPTR